MPAGVCSAALAGGLQVLAAFSGARLWANSKEDVAAQAWSCRRVGGWYAFATSGSLRLGCCLPARCASAPEPERLRAAAAQLGVAVDSLLAYTSLRPFEAGAVSVVAGSNAVRPASEWFRLSLDDLVSGPYHDRLAAVDVLGMTFRDFRGSMLEYTRFTLAAANHLAAWCKPGATLLVPGTLSWVIDLPGGFKVRTLSGVPLCSLDEWRAFGALPELGVELEVPPMWQALVEEAPDPILRFSVPTGSQLVSACRMDLASTRLHLHWAVPADALEAAVALASRGPCGVAAATALPELAAASAFVASNETVPWQDVADRALFCTEGLEGAFWEYHLDVSGWPALRAVRGSRGRPRREPLGGPEGRLLAFVCAPTWFHLEQALWEFAGVRGEESCSDAHAVAGEVLPLVLAYKTGQYEELRAAAPPQAFNVLGGGRSSKETRWQVAGYHTNAVHQRREAPALVNVPAPGEAQALAAARRQPSAAVCIIGLARTLALPEVYRSLAANASRDALGAETSTFFVMDLEDRSLADFNGVFASVPPTALALVNGTSWGELPACHAWSRCGPACTQQFHKLRACLHLVKAAEVVRGRQFDWVLRYRPDVEWLAPIGDLERLDIEAVHVVMRQSKIHDLEDNFALVPRRFADAYFGIGEWCPADAEVRATQCTYPLADGKGHIYPECAIKTRLEQLGVRIAAFPRLYRIRREDGCRQADPLRGNTKSEKCGTGVG